MRTTGPKCRICRRLGEKLFLKGDRCLSEKCPIAQGAAAPGQLNIKHPKGKPSQFKQQLVEKQKIRKSYDINERHLRNYYKKAIGKEGQTGQLMLQMLETRLDNVIYRAGLAGSRAQARQLVSHGHFWVNGRRVDIPSYQTRAGDEILIKTQSESKKPLADLKLDPKSAIRWLQIDPKKKLVTVAALPDQDDFSDNFSIQSVVEFYSR